MIVLSAMLAALIVGAFIVLELAAIRSTDNHRIF